MKYEIRKADRLQRPNPLKNATKHPIFGYVVLVLILAAVQLAFMYGDFITLTISRAISQTIVYTIAAMGMSVLVGMSGLSSLGTAAFIGLGAYLAGNLMKNFNLPYTVVLLAVILAGVLVGVLVGFLSLRTRGVHLMIISLALGVVLMEVYQRPNKFTGGPNGLSGVPKPKLFMALQLKRDTTYFVLLAVMFILIIITLNLINSPTGRALLAMRNSPSLAQAMGISVLWHRVFAFVYATVFAMLAGAMYIASLGSSTARTWITGLSLNILAAVILGGGIKPAGAIMGSFIIFGLDLAVLQNIPYFQKNSDASLIFTGVLMILIVMKYPGGLTRMLVDIKNLFNRTVAKRRLYKYGADK